MPIETPQDLRDHVSLAIQVELSTIPPYLYAMYSLVDQASEAALLIRSIAAEEMLHAALATNLLLGLGGTPSLVDLMPRYPELLPHHTPDLMLKLAPCSYELVRETFMTIERPEARGALPEADEYETLGQFYQAIEEAIDRLSDSYDLFADPQPSCQLADPSFYTPVQFDAQDSGGLGLIDDIASADVAIAIIIHQGEGLSDERWADPSHQELTHYYKLKQISDEVSPIGDVRPALTNPRTADLPPGVQPVSDLFNALYRYLFMTLDELFEVNEDKGALIGRLYGLMSVALRPVALYLMTLPVGDGYVAGPTFEIYDLDTDDPLAALAKLATTVGAAHPRLRGLAAVLRAV